ncbi:MAG TPA: hypothetical protein VIH03_02515 [Nitrososphaerales archaeon]
MKTGKFIVITGIDGSGKDFVVGHLKSTDPDAIIIKTPTEPFIPARLHVDEFALEVPIAHYYFYLASVIHASNLVEKALGRGNVYCVRYLLDTVVYHRAMGLSIELEYETALYRIQKPDCTFFLTVDDERVRQNRLKSRGKITVGDKIVNQEKLRRAILEEYGRYSNEYIQINNCDRDITDVAADIRKWM